MRWRRYRPDYVVSCRCLAAFIINPDKLKEEAAWIEEKILAVREGLDD